MKFERALAAVDEALSKLSRARILGVSLLAVAAVGVPDYLIGFEISLAIFYLLPVGIATWYGGRAAGALVVVISTVIALVGDVSAGHLSTGPWIMGWNGLLHFSFMLVVAYLLYALHTQFDMEQGLARSDPVTGISNSRAFLEHLRYRLDLAARDGRLITLAYIDLDDFKRINDEGGHDEGDRVLRLVARTLTAAIRRTDVVARLGGDEFALLIAGANRTGAESLVTKIRHSLQQALDREETAVTCSIGCVTFQELPPSADDAIKAADSLMYKVKSQGKNAVAFEVYTHQPGNAAQADAAENSQ